MENKTLGEAETTKIANAAIGNKETETLEAKKVHVQGYRIDKVQFKERKDPSLKLVLICSHPDREDTIQLSKAKILKGDKVQTNGLWINTDEDGNISKNSTLAEVLNYFDLENIDGFEDMKVDTEKDEQGYLIIKAY